MSDQPPEEFKFMRRSFHSWRFHFALCLFLGNEKNSQSRVFLMMAAATQSTSMSAVGPQNFRLDFDLAPSFYPVAIARRTALGSTTTQNNGAVQELMMV